MKNYGEIAENYFKQGYNCSQSVVAAFAPELGISEALALRMSVGFGGGVGRLRQVCGAFCGLTQVVSLYAADPADPQDKSRIYAIIQRLAEQFRAQAGGSIVCAELLGLKAPEGSAQAEARTAAYYQKRPCARLVRIAAEITGEWMETCQKA